MKSFRTLWSSRRHVATLAAALGLVSSLACASGELQEGLGPQSEAALDTVVTYTGTNAEANIQGLTLSPSSATLAPGQSRTFSAIGWINGSSSPAPNTTWTATGGSITSGGVYTAGSTPGTYQVKVVSMPTWHSETATVTVSGSASPSPSLAALVVTPGDLSLGRYTTQQFTATAVMSNGTTQSNPAVTWYATGGTISNSGSYRSGGSSGSYWVIATASNGLADTTRITVSSSSSTVSSVTVTPGSATVAAGATQQFSATARLTNGSTQSNPSITWSATGGTINGSGLFTAGSTAGSYRVIGQSSNGKADTSGVTVSATAPTITAVTLTPGNVSLNTQGSQAFSSQVTYSNGTTQTNPSLSWSATGGSMGGGQVYTAGTIAGTYRVIASAANGRADTSVVTVNTPTAPPPSGGGSYPNRPASFTRVLSNYGFDQPLPTREGAQITNGDGWYVNNGQGRMATVSDPTSPSGGNVLQWTYAAGQGTPTSSAGFGLAYHSIPSGVNKIYVSFYLWHDANFEYNRSANKLFYLEPGNVVLESWSYDGWFSVYNGALSTWLRPQLNTAIRGGQWERVEYLVDATTDRIKVWVNGQLRLDQAASMNGGWRELKFDSTWGGGMGPTTRTSYRRVDDVYIAYE